MTRMNPTQIQALARFLEPVKPDWDFHGIRAALSKLDLSWEVAAWIAIQCAADPTAKTPGAMSNPIYRDRPAEETARVSEVGRDNVLRLRRQAAETAQVAATPARIREIRAASRWPSKGGTA